MKGDDVRLAKQPFQVAEFDPGFDRSFGLGRHKRVVGQDVHVKGLATDPGEFSPNPAQPD